MEGAAILLKSKRFAVRIVNLYKYQQKEKREFILSKQLLRSGTGIGANVTEAEAAVSKKDFLAKMYIAFKEAHETKYWLDLLYETDYLSPSEYRSVANDCNELISMLSAITKSTAENLKSDHS